MSFYEIGVVAHTARAEQAWELFNAVHGRVISVDDGELGCNRNHLRVMTDLRGLSAEWYVILEDDAEPVEGFRKQLLAALNASPTPVVSLYLGTSNPIHWQATIARTMTAAKQADAHWITSPGFLLHAVGYAIRADVFDDILASIDPYHRRPIDEQVSLFCRYNGMDVGYTHPSLVDHKDGPTVIGIHPDGAPRLLPRKAWKTGTRETWFPRTVELS